MILPLNNISGQILEDIILFPIFAAEKSINWKKVQ